MWRVLLTIALRNLVAHRTATVVVGSIIFFGTFLAVLGTAMLDSVNRSLAESITSSLAGHLQIYSRDARDPLNLFGASGGGDDFGTLPDFATVRREVESLPNVRAVIPMGLQNGIVLQGNEIDLTLGALRDAIASGDHVRRETLRQKLLNMSEDLVADLTHRLPIAADRGAIERGLADLETMRADAFWRDLDAHTEDRLLFLESRIAPLAEDGRTYWLRNLGTDVHRFSQLFDRFEVVKGQMIPPGQRGILFSEIFYEKNIKHRVARELDRARVLVEELGKTFASDPALQDIARRLPRQYGRIENELSPRDAAELSEALRAMLPEAEADLSAQLQAFLSLDDATFPARYAFFYDQIAPRIRLYGLPIGETFAVRSVAKSGYLKTVELKVWGTYMFRSLEKSDLAGVQNLIDMMTFRELYGEMSEDTRAELAEIKRAVGVEALSRPEVEDALFGEAATEAPPALRPDEAAEALAVLDPARIALPRDTERTEYTQEQIDDGLAINAAVILEDPEQLRATQAEIARLSEEQGLGLQVVDWQTATGLIGQFILLLRLVLLVAIFIIFVVALVIINNSMVMATLERTPEIGTMRAIGAQRHLVMGMFLLETTVLGLLAGTAGAVAAAALVTWLGQVGLPAPNEMMIFVFSGPRLFPAVTAGNLIFGLVVVLLVSLASTLYPARIAARIQPVVAMQTAE